MVRAALVYCFFERGAVYCIAFDTYRNGAVSYGYCFDFFVDQGKGQIVLDFIG
jgi:hypothetical protein